MSAASRGPIVRLAEVPAEASVPGGAGITAYVFARPGSETRWMRVTLCRLDPGGRFDVRDVPGAGAEYVYYILQGRVRVSLPDREDDLDPDTAVVFPCGARHDFRAVSAGGVHVLRLDAGAAEMPSNVPDGRPAGAAAVPFVLRRAEIPERTGVTGHINMSAYRFARAGQTTRWLHATLNVLREGGGINLHYHEGIDADHAYYLSEGRVEAQVAGRTYREIGPHSLMVFESKIPHGFRVVGAGGASVLRLGASPSGGTTGGSIWLPPSGASSTGPRTA